jgi:hypothetical protein
VRRDHRFLLALGLTAGTSLAFLAFLPVRPVSDEAVRLTANLAQLLAASAAAWAVGQATWVWYEHLARRELPFPSLVDVGYRAPSRFASLTQEGTYATGAPSDVGWFAGHLLSAAAARRPAPWPAGSRPACATRTRWPVLREADVAMYLAKARGKGRFQLGLERERA